MLACQLSIGTLFSITVSLAIAVDYVDEESLLCKNYDFGGTGDMPRRNGQLEVTMNGARYEGVEPKGLRLVTLKADCKTSKLTGCAIKDSDGNPVSVDNTKGDGCTDQFKLNAKDNSLKMCRFVCPLTEKPVVTCEGFVADSLCLTSSGAKSTHSDQLTSITVNKAFVGSGSVSADLDQSYEIEYRSDCCRLVIKRCGIKVAGEWKRENAQCNPFDSGRCTTRFDLAVAGKTKRCRMCCFTFTAATLHCNA